VTVSAEPLIDPSVTWKVIWVAEVNVSSTTNRPKTVLSP
jgi:hypothetical protein